MKKILAVSVLLSALAVFGVPMLASAQDALPNQCTIKANPNVLDCPASGLMPFSSTTPAGASGATCCLFSTINNIVNWIFLIVIAIAVLFIVIAAFMFITSGGSPEKTASARQYILFAAVGIAVALLARAVPAIVRMIVGI